MDEDSSRAALDYKLLLDCRQYLWTRLSFCASQTLFKTSFNISYFLSLLLLCRLSWITYTLDAPFMLLLLATFTLFDSSGLWIVQKHPIHIHNSKNPDVLPRQPQ